MRRRRRLAALLLAVALSIAGTVTGVGTDIVGEGLRRVVPSGGGSPSVAEAQSLLLAWPTETSGGAGIVLFGVDPDGGASALLVPPRAQVEVPSLGSDTFGGALRAGASSLTLSLQNVLGVEISDVVGLDHLGLVEVLAPAAPLDVRFRRGVTVGERRYRTGEHRVDAGEAADLLAHPSDGDLDHLVVVHAVLEAWLARLDATALEATATSLRTAGLTPEESHSVIEVLEVLTSHRVAFEILGVELLPFPGEERYRVVTEQVPRTVERLFPSLRLADTPERIRVEILNGTGEAGLARSVAELVVPHGFEIVLTGNAAEFGVERTLVVLQDPAAHTEARRLVEALGVGEIRRARNPLTVVDISVVVGADFAARGG